MCLIGVAWQVHPRYELVVAANRDEFHARPAAPAAPWPEAPEVFGGRDLLQGGSWLAVSARRRLACVTNVRRMIPPNPAAPSRGRLVAGFVQGAMSAQEYAAQLAPHAMHYSGFNLLIWDGRELYYLNNHPAFVARKVTPGVHVVSNADLDTPWPKTRRLASAMEGWVRAGQGDDAPLVDALADESPAPDAELPDTGVGRDMERMLSPPFIRSERYGTRCSTLVKAGGTIDFLERRFGADGAPTGETRQSLK